MKPKGKGRFKCPPVTIGSYLSQYFKEKGLDSKVQEYKIWTHWPEVVGPKLASKCTPLMLRNHRLTITVATAPWLTQLQLMKLKLMDNISKYLRIQLSDIYFKVGSLPMSSESPKENQKSADQHIMGRNKRDMNNRIEELKAETNGDIQDPELKEILNRVLEKHVTI